MDWKRLLRRTAEEVAAEPIPPQPGDLTPVGLNPKLIRYHSPFHKCPECGGQMLKLAWSDSNLLDLGVPSDEVLIGPVCAHCLTVPFSAFVGVGR